jgi:transposase-like protein
VYLALAIRLDGQKELLGMWIEQNEGAKFWLGVLNELKNRRIEDRLIAAADGLSGFPDAINAAFPNTEAQPRVVHMARNSVKYISYKDRKDVTSDLKKMYLSPNEEEARRMPDAFAEKWDSKYPMISKSRRDRRNEVIPFLKFPENIRRAVYTTNAIESVNYSLQRALKPQQSFPNDEAAMKLIFMALQRISKKRAMPIRDWGAALNQFAVFYPERVPL